MEMMELDAAVAEAEEAAVAGMEAEETIQEKEELDACKAEQRREEEKQEKKGSSPSTTSSPPSSLALKSPVTAASKDSPKIKVTLPSPAISSTSTPLPPPRSATSGLAERRRKQLMHVSHTPSSAAPASAGGHGLPISSSSRPLGASGTFWGSHVNLSSLGGLTVGGSNGRPPQPDQQPIIRPLTTGTDGMPIGPPSALSSSLSSSAAQRPFSNFFPPHPPSHGGGRSVSMITTPSQPPPPTSFIRQVSDVLSVLAQGVEQDLLNASQHGGGGGGGGDLDRSRHTDRSAGSNLPSTRTETSTLIKPRIKIKYI